MSTDDDFEAALRGRLHDLADREDDWDDPTPVARELAAAGIAPDDDPAILSPAPVTTRRRLGPTLAVAAVVLALVVGGGLGIRELARSGGGGGTGMSVAADRAAPEAASPDPAGAGETSSSDAGGSAAPGGGPITGGSPTDSGGGSSATSCPSGTAGACHDTAGCELGAPATSTGPLADIATVRASGIVGPRTTSGGTVAVPYQLTFGETRGSAQVRAAQVQWTTGAGGALCNDPGAARPGVVEVVPVAAGGGTSGTATFVAVDSTGSPLPNGEYQVAVVIPYSADGSGASQLVSAPITVVVS